MSDLKNSALKDLLDCYEVSDDMSIPDLCERVWDAAVSHVTPQIRAAAIEDAAVTCEQHGSGARYVYQREEFTECAAKIRALAALSQPEAVALHNGETPETDVAVLTVRSPSFFTAKTIDVVPIEVSQCLERQRDELRTENEKLRNALQVAQFQIKAND